MAQQEEKKRGSAERLRFRLVLEPGSPIWFPVNAKALWQVVVGAWLWQGMRKQPSPEASRKLRRASFRRELEWDPTTQTPEEGGGALVFSSDPNATILQNTPLGWKFMTCPETLTPARGTGKRAVTYESHGEYLPGSRTECVSTPVCRMMASTKESLALLCCFRHAMIEPVNSVCQGHKW